MDTFRNIRVVYKVAFCLVVAVFILFLFFIPKRICDQFASKAVEATDEPKDFPRTIQIGMETREIVQSYYGSYSLDVDVPYDGILETAISVDPEMAEEFFGRAIFSISIANEKGEPLALYEQYLSISKTYKPHWEDVSVDLSSYSGRRITLVFNKEFQFVQDTPDVANLPSMETLFWAMPKVRPRKLMRSPNVILVSLDTVRADHLHFMGYHRDTSPNLDQLALDGVFFKTVISQSSWTTPSHFSIFTSTYPSVNKGNQPIQEFQRTWDDSIPMAAELLSGKGYKTAAFTGYGSISARFGFFRGFDFYNENSQYISDAEQNFDKAIAWLRKNRDRSFFLFVHTYEPHIPYISSHFLELEGIPDSNEMEAWRRSGSDQMDEAIWRNASEKWRIASYDGDIREADTALGKLIDEMKAIGLMENTLLVVTSDHGEDLTGSRTPPNVPLQLGHGFNLYDEQIHVPLVICGPGVEVSGKGIEFQVRLIDVLPTIFDYLGLPAEPTFQGMSLRGMIEGLDQSDRPAFSEAVTYGTPRESLRSEGYKFIHRLSEIPLGSMIWGNVLSEFELYHLPTDPGETINLAERYPNKLRLFNEQIKSFLPAKTTDDGGGTIDMDVSDDPELIKRLRSLGYLE